MAASEGRRPLAYDVDTPSNSDDDAHVEHHSSSDDEQPHRQRRVAHVGFEHPVQQSDSENIHFTLGADDQVLEDDDTFIGSSSSSQPIAIPTSNPERLTDAFFTPPRMYMGNLRHFSVGAVPAVGFLAGESSYHGEGGPLSPRMCCSPSASESPQQDRSLLRVQVRPRERRRSEAFFGQSSGHPSSTSESPVVRPRDRSHSAPSILTPAQRQCAEELRRISDEFDRFYHSMDHERDVAPGNQRPASFPRLRQRSMTTWWQHVVQVLRPSRPSPHSPIEEREPGVEDHQL